MTKRGSVPNVASGSTAAGPIRIEVHAKPRAKRTKVVGVRDGVVDIALQAPPVDGAANDELLRFLAEHLDLAKRDVKLLRGEGSRTKLVEITGLDAETLWRRLSSP